MVVRFVKELDLLLKDGLTSSFTSDFRNQYDALMDAADDKWEALTDSDIEYLKRCFGPK